MLRDYYLLAKPERTYANSLTALAGFLLGAKWHLDWGLLLATLAGVTLVVASANVVNNYFDRDIDELMPRTKRRALVRRSIAPASALGYAIVLGLAGFAVLAAAVSWLVTAMGAIAYFDYVALYGPAKKRTPYATLIGTVAGAMPVAAGYCAASGRLDRAAVILFIIMAIWQLPHFYGISLYRLKDYQAAKVPVWPAVKGTANTKWQVLLSVVAYMIALPWLTIFGFTNYFYLLVMEFLAVIWLEIGWSGLKTLDDARWGRRMFLFSLVVLMAFIVMLPLGAIHPPR